MWLLEESRLIFQVFASFTGCYCLYSRAVSSPPSKDDVCSCMRTPFGNV